MPLYKYRCAECDNTFRVLQKNGKKEEDPECPECGGTETKREISSVGIRFKGSGFYRTDYGDSNYKGNGNNGSGEGNEKNAGKTDKTESSEMNQGDNN